MAEAEEENVVNKKNNSLLVEILLPSTQDRDIYNDAVQQYVNDGSVASLVTKLESICKTEEQNGLFEIVRPYLRHEQQVEFNMLAPFIQSRIRVIRLRRKGNSPLGFSIRGGYEHGTGVFVSEVQSNSEANRQGLRVGDQILRINGFNIDQAIHEDVLNLLKSKPGVVLKVKSVGMIPVKDKKKDPLTWKVVDNGGAESGSHSPADSIVDGTNSYSGSSNYEEAPEVHVTLNIIGSSGLGLTIVKGPPDTPGIFVQHVKPNSLSEHAGLQVGDQIVLMNGTAFLDIGFDKAVTLMKENRELRLVLRKGAGLDLFPEEKSRLAAAMLNGASHTTKDQRRRMSNHSRDEEKPTNGKSNHTNGIIIAEVIQHPPPVSAQDDIAEGHNRQPSSATTATVSENDVSISETNVPFAISPQEKPATPSSITSENSSPPSTLSLESLDNGHSDLDKASPEPSIITENVKRVSDLDEALKREEERLAEERRKLEVDQARLKEEAERLAQERRELEEERRLRNDAVGVIPLPPPTPPFNLLHEIQNKQLTPMTPTSAGGRARIRPLSVDSTKYHQEEDRKRHEQLMQEFQKMHKKMFGGEEKPPIPEGKVSEPTNEVASFNFSRRQQVSVAPKPPPGSLGVAHVPRAVSQPNLRQEEDSTDSSSETKPGGDSGKNEAESQQPASAIELKRTSVVPSKPVLPVAITAFASGNNNNNNNNNTTSPQSTPKESFVLVSAAAAAPDVSGSQSSPPQQASSASVPANPRRLKDFPITDSRGPVPKPPQTYFESKPQKGPLVTIGVYPDNSRHNRFSNLSSGEGVRNRQNQFETRSSSPSSNAPISVSVTSSSASSSATSSPQPPERKVVNGQPPQGQAQSTSLPVSFKVTYNSKTNASVNSITMNKSMPSQGSPNSLTLSLNSKPTSTPVKVNSGTNSTTVPPVTKKDPKDLIPAEELEGREVKTLTIPKVGPLNMKVSGGTGQPDSGGRILVSELWEGGCIGPKVDIHKGDQVMMVGDKSLLNVKLTQANVILREAMSNTTEPLKLVIAREKS